MEELSKENTEMETENKKMQKTIETLKVSFVKTGTFRSNLACNRMNEKKMF
jgi:hypothetical protein